MTDKTHVSYNGFLQRVVAVVDKAPYDARFVAYGRLVNPSGHYYNAPLVALWWIDGAGGYAERLC